MGNPLKRSEAAGLRSKAAGPGPRAFWDHLVFTRIVAWKKDFNNVARYVCVNLWEGVGVPVRKLLAKGYKILDISEDGAIFVPVNATTEFINALKPE